MVPVLPLLQCSQLPCTLPDASPFMHPLLPCARADGEAEDEEEEKPAKKEKKKGKQAAPRLIACSAISGVCAASGVVASRRAGVWALT